MAQQARIRCLVGRAREEARQRKEKGKTGFSCLTFDEARCEDIYICKTIWIEQVRYEQKT